VTLRRDALLEDAYAALRDTGGAIRGRLVVTFVNEAGVLEAGLDHGGLVKAFLEEVRALVATLSNPRNLMRQACWGPACTMAASPRPAWRTRAWSYMHHETKMLEPYAIP